MLRKEYNVCIYNPNDPEKNVKEFKRCKGRQEVINFINDCFGGASIVTKTTLQTKLYNPQQKKINKILNNCIDITPIEPYTDTLEPVVTPTNMISS